MKTALVIVLTAAVVIVGSTLTIMNKACKSGYHAWCNPMFTARHHITIGRPPDFELPRRRNLRGDLSFNRGARKGDCDFG